jgi:branched-chain amino acid transport system permease protein
MRALGYNVRMYQFIAFAISGVLGGVAGVLFVYHTGFVTPSQLGLLTSAEAFLMVLLGGASTVLGPLLGAILLVVGEDLLSSWIPWWNLVLGLAFIAVVLFARKGILVALTQRLPAGDSFEGREEPLSREP